MAITWFPGHMNRATKELRKLAKVSDLVIELLDARAPNASRNPLLASIAPELPRIYVLSKADLADQETTAQWYDYFKQQESKTCLISSIENPISAGNLLAAIINLSIEISANSSKQMIVAGIPNVGKSTFINKICGRKVAKTGNEPAITKRHQRVKLLENVYLVDTPGMMWPKLEDQEAAYKLAAIGTIRNTAIDSEEIAWFMAEYLLEHQTGALKNRYGVTAELQTAEQVIEAIAKASGAKNKGSRINRHKVSETLLNDLRSGKLGRFSLESPPTD